MATFEELMEQFRNPGETGLPDTFADDLATAYSNDLSVRDAAVTDRENKVLEANNAVTAREAEITRLKAVNYDLLIAAPKTGEPADNDETGENSASGIDSLFE